ncbi:MAG: aminotransferase class V-fold PLP-dependent enzyme [Sciscionella sp.]
MIDLERVRADTPACVDLIFLDSAGSSLPPAPVLDEVVGHLRREAEVGGYCAAQHRADDIEAGHGVFAELLDCEPDEVAFTDSATRSWLSLLDSVPLDAGDRVLISWAEYGANAVALLRLAERSGARVDVVPSDESGQLSVEALRTMLDERVKLVSLVQVPTNGGLVNPVDEVVDAAHEVGALVLLDACQSVGQLPVRIRESGVDMLTGTGRKWLRGPRGTGFLVVRRDAAQRLQPRLFDHSAAFWESPNSYRLRDGARVHQLWEYGVAGRLGLIAAARYALDLGVEEIADAVRERADRARAGLATIPGVLVRDLGRRRCGLVSFTVDGVDPTEVRDRLAERDITVTVSAPQGTRIDMTERGLSGLVRASPHYFVSLQQVDAFCAAVDELARGKA